MSKKKRSKYGARKTTVNGIEFDSKAEAKRYGTLIWQSRLGLITGLVLQPRFILMPKFRHEGKAVREIAYVADFQYVRDGVTVVEDVKGVKTEAYKIKAKLFIHQYAAPNGWHFREITT